METEGRNISARKNVLYVKNGRRVNATWDSNSSILIKYWNGTKIHKIKKHLEGVDLSFVEMPDTSSVRQRILKLCPSIITSLQSKIDGLENSRLLSKTFEAEWLSQPTNYHNYVDENGSGRDYFCNLSDKSGGVGWMLFVRVNSSNDEFTEDEVSPLFIEMRANQGSNAGEIIWQISK